LIGSLGFPEITVPNEVPSENILVGTSFPTVISRKFQGTFFVARISTGSLFILATNTQ
jgi:hypothetical protein